MLAAAETGPGQNHEPRIPARPSTWLTGTRGIESHLLPCKLLLCRKLGEKWSRDLSPRVLNRIGVFLVAPSWLNYNEYVTFTPLLRYFVEIYLWTFPF